MSNKACIEFGLAHLKDDDIRGKKVIEVGSYDVNGTLRSVINDMNPRCYLGVDIIEGSGVDMLCSINDLVTNFGKNSFDVVITTELMEHVQNWRNAISNLKQILKPEGIILLTTRSKGFNYHGYPFDFWRYEVEDMRVLFADFLIEIIEEDPFSPGVFIKAYKPGNFSEKNLKNYDLYSIIKGKHCRRVTEFNVIVFKAKRLVRRFPSCVLPTCVKTIIKRALYNK